MAAAEFAPLAETLANTAPSSPTTRGYAASTVDDPDAPSSVEQRADDVNAILDDLRAESADLFGSSGGAVTGLALVTRYPGRIRMLVAHEPPSLLLLPDAAEQRANTEAIVETFHRDGFEAGWGHFMANAGFDVTPDDAPPTNPEPSAARWPILRHRPACGVATTSPTSRRCRRARRARWSASARTPAGC